MSRLTATAMVAAAVVLLSGCGGGSESPSSAAVTATGFHFSPVRIEVRAGGSVRFTNLDRASHTVTADTGSPVDFDTGRLGSGEGRSIEFDEAGSYPYVCLFHPLMTGMVDVVE